MRLSPTRTSVALLASGALLGGLTACGSDGDSAAESDAPLEVWTRSNPESAETYEKVFAAFTKKTGIKVDYKPVMEFDKQLQSRASSKDLPDVLINDSASLGTYQAQGLLTPIEPGSIAGHDAVSQQNWDTTKGLDGEHYGVPYSRQAFATFVRKDWREKLGMEVPRTWDDLTELATAFATEDPDGNGKDDTYGMVVPGSPDRGYLAWWASSYVWQGGGDYIEPSGEGTYQSAIDSPGTTKAVEWIKKQFCTKGNVQPGALTADTANAPHFDEGAAGIYLSGPYKIAGFDERPGKDVYEVIPTPEGPAGATTLAEGENIYFGAGSDKTEAQQKLAEYLITPEAQKAAMSDDTTPVVRIPVNKSLKAAEVLGDKRWQVFQDQYDNDAKTFPSDIDFTAVKQTVAEGLNGIMADCGADNIASGLKKLDSAVNDELKSQDLLK